MDAHLDSQFLDRVRRAYCAALGQSGPAHGSIWEEIDGRRADIHAALVADNNFDLREIFANPAATDLYYGCDTLCRAQGAAIRPEDFVEEALKSGHARYASYQATRIAALLDQAGPRAVVEIGPGMGRAAYFSYRAGITDYSTIDLPLGIVAQACFLARALGPGALWFDGETAADANVGKIKLFFAGRPPRGHYGAALNVDSMTEMPRDIAFDYACWLGDVAHFFLSINHQSNVFTVATLMAAAGAKRLSRRHERPDGYGKHLHYVEEVYALRPVKAAGVRRRAFRYVTGVLARQNYYGTKLKRLVGAR